MGNVAVSLDDSLSLSLSTVVDSGVLSSHSEMTGQVWRLIKLSVHIKNVHTVHTFEDFYLFRDDLLLMWHIHFFLFSFSNLSLLYVCLR